MIRRSISIILFAIMLLSVGGAYATWIYAELPPLSVEQQVGISISVFDYPPEQILPGGDTTPATPGENHMALIELILWEDDKDYGLNINKNAHIHQLLKSQDVVYSNQKSSGGNLKFIIDQKFNTFGLYYCIEKISDTLYYCYTFSLDELSTVSGSTQYMSVYRTSLEKTDIWRATVCYVGVAQTKSLSALGESAASHTVGYSIDVTTWRLPFNQ